MRWAVFAAAVWLASGADVDELHRAARTGNLEQLRSLLDRGVNVNAADARGGTALHDAAWAGEAGIVSLLLSHGADVNARHSEAGSTPLHYAITTNHLQVAELLIAQGADVQAKYPSGA